MDIVWENIRRIDVTFNDEYSVWYVECYDADNNMFGHDNDGGLVNFAHKKDALFEALKMAQRHRIPEVRVYQRNGKKCHVYKYEKEV